MAFTVSTTLTTFDGMDTDSSVNGVLETDFAYIGTGCIGFDLDIETEACFNAAQTATNMTNMHIYVPMLCLTALFLDTKANGGMQIAVQDSGGNQAAWNVGGSDTYPGGWKVFAAYTGNTPDWTSGTVNYAQITHIGTRWKGLAKSKLAQNCFMDRTSYGNGAALKVTGTNTTTDIGWSEVLSVADAADATRGYMSTGSGSYISVGPIQIGEESTATNTTYSDDGNLLVWPDMPVSSTHYGITGREGTGTTSITLKNQVIKAVGARFALDMDDANLTTFSMTGSTLILAGATNFKAGQTLTGNAFDNCSKITPSTSTFENNVVRNSIDTSGALLWPGGTSVKNCIFNSNSRSIEITQTASQTFDALTFTSNTYDVHLNNGGTDISVSKNNGSNPTTYIATGGGVVTFVGASTTVTLKAQTDSGTAISGARGFLRTGASGSLPFNASTSISNSGTTATVTHTAHGLTTGDKIVNYNCAQNENLGVHTITVTGVNTYTYTTTTLTASDTANTYFVFVEGTTDVNGEVSASRVYPADQAATGAIRKSSSAPYYKSAPLSGTVSSTLNTTFTGTMISDD